MSDLQDIEARNRIRTIVREPMFVEAGAGTGKTSELTARVVQLVATGDALASQLAVITFTEAAASEVRERIREQLMMQVRSSGSDVDRAHSSRCKIAADSIDDMAIETIHAFARRILQGHTSAVGLPPVFDIVEGTRAQLRWIARWRRFVGSTLASGQPLPHETEHLLRCGIALGLTIGQMRDLARVFDSSWHRLGDVTVRHVDTVDISAVVSKIDEALAFRVHCNKSDDKMLEHLDTVVSPFRDLVAGLEKLDVYSQTTELATAQSMKKANSGRTGNWNGYLDDLKVCLVGIDSAVSDALAPMRRFVLHGVEDLLIGFTLDGARERVASGRIEFHDLLVLARNAVRDDAGVRSALSERFGYILVDEFQDTDPLQAELVHELTARPPSVMFTVGDPRQSIYRFRGADVRQYKALRSHFSDSLTELRTNFRTAANVLEWIENVTSKLTGVVGEVEPVSLVGHRSEFEGSVQLLGAKHEKGIRAPEVREVEAAQIVEAIRAIVDSGVVVDGARPARFSDVAILIPTRALLASLERALRAATVPYRVESRSLVWSTQELRDVLSILKAINDPTDQLSVVAALRSAAFGCGDDELLRWKQAGGGWNYLDDFPKSDLPVCENVLSAFKWFSAMHSHRWYKTVPQLIDEVLEERALFELAYALPRQREAWQRLRFLQDQAMQWHQGGGTGLGAFVDWATVQTEHGADARESIVAESDDDAVRIMTIHASKGLEFPVVVVAGLSSAKPTNGSGRALWVDDECELRLGPKTLAWETAGFADADAAESADEQDEGDRLLYVALTRARDHLVVSLNRSHAARRTLAERLESAAVGIDIPTRRKTSAKTAPVDDAEPAPRTRIDRAEVIKAASRYAFMSATRINRLIEGEPEVPVGGAQATYSTAHRMAFGRVVHSVLETIDLRNPHDLDARIDNAILQETLVTGRQAAVRKSLGLALAAPVIGEALSSADIWRELYVVGNFEGLTLEGVVDLCFDTPTGLVVVDYKTDSVPAAGADEILSHYRWQLLTYSHLLASTLGRPVEKVSLLLIGPDNDEAIEVSVRGEATQSRELEIQLSALVQFFGLP